jgi:cyclopropane-fatty-acyl-phospholipid synthase
MQFISNMIPLIERVSIPDPVARLAIRQLVSHTSRSLAREADGGSAAFAHAMAELPIATHTREANAQHYELPPEFFGLVLGPQLKYSSCFYESDASSLAEAEEAALEATAAHADLSDGQGILELGCGWGSFALYAAQRFPNARIVAVSNSSAQRRYIEGRIASLGLGNISVFTADMNDFRPDEVFDRVVSIEMFEHMVNWRRLLGRIRSWLKPEGRLFVHVFSHARAPYKFDVRNKADWIAQHFFSGGIMPSHDLMRVCTNDFRVEQDWRWSGQHYERTALDWLARFDSNRDAIDAVLRETYGPDANVWRQRWRLFFLATAGLFGHNCGAEWGVSHYRLAPIDPKI